ncbi:MAG: hypothetical protein V1781_09530 [Bacteroidota bacterium]
MPSALADGKQITEIIIGLQPETMPANFDQPFWTKSLSVDYRYMP